MPADRSPSPFLATLAAAGGLVMLMFHRSGEGRRPARAVARGTDRPVRRPAGDDRADDRARWRAAPAMVAGLLGRRDAARMSPLAPDAAARADAVVAPPLPYGSSGEHAGFPGTLSIGQDEVVITGHAIEARINAERPERDFMPSPGLITAWAAPVGSDVRVDTACFPGWRIPPYYDSLVAKLIVHGTDRADALARARAALGLLRIDGVTTTVPVHQALLADEEFAAGGVDTAFFERFLAAHQPHLAGVA